MSKVSNRRRGFRAGRQRLSLFDTDGGRRNADAHINIAVGGEGQWRPFCEAIARADLVDDPQYRTQADRFAERPALMALLREAFKQRPSAEWLERLEEHAARGPIRVVGQPITMTRTPADIRVPAPDPGEHTDEILAEAGLTGRRDRGAAT